MWVQQSPSRLAHTSHHPGGVGGGGGGGGNAYCTTTLPHGAPDSMNRPWSISGVQPNGATGNHHPHYRTMPSHVPPPPRPPRTSSLQKDMEVRDQVNLAINCQFRHLGMKTTLFIRTNYNDLKWMLKSSDSLATVMSPIRQITSENNLA